jgi:hypothetical protein
MLMAPASWPTPNSTPAAPGFCRTARDHPLHATVINVAGCQVLGIAQDEGDHPMRPRGERPGGQAYPATLDQDRTGETLLHRTTRPCKAAPARSQSREPG